MGDNSFNTSIVLNPSPTSSNAYWKPLSLMGVITTNKEKITASLPNSQKSTFSMQSIKTYEWSTWNGPAYTERLKKSYYIIQQTSRDTTLESEKE